MPGSLWRLSSGGQQAASHRSVCLMSPRKQQKKASPAWGAGQETPPRPCPTAGVRTGIERCCCCQLPRPQPLERLGTTPTPRTRCINRLGPRGQGETLLKQLETDPRRERGCVTAGGLLQGHSGLCPCLGLGGVPHTRVSPVRCPPHGAAQGLCVTRAVLGLSPQTSILSSCHRAKRSAAAGTGRKSRWSQGQGEGGAEPSPLGCSGRGEPPVLPSEGG